MSGNSTANNGEPNDCDFMERKAVSRREFLRMAGIAGAALSLGAGLGGLLAACGSETTTTTGAATTGASETTVTTGAASGEPIVIGLLNEQTGYISNLGIEAYKGAVVGFNTFPSQIAGRELKYVLEDPASDPSIALDKARKLVEVDKVAAIFSPVDSASALAIGSYVDSVQVPLIRSMFGSERLTLDYQWTWQPTGIQNQCGYAAGVFAGELDHKIASVLALESDDGRGFIDGMKLAFAESEGQVVQEQWYPVGTSDFAPFVVNIDKSADVLFSWVASDSIIPGYKTLESFKTYEQMEFISPEGWYDSEAIWGEAKDAITHVTFASVWYNTITTKGSQEFLDAFKVEWDYVPSNVGAQAYNNVNIMVDALTKTNGDTSGAALAQAINETNIDGVLGEGFHFADRIGVMPLYMIRMKKESDTLFTPEVRATYLVTPKLAGGKIEYTAAAA